MKKTTIIFTIYILMFVNGMRAQLKFKNGESVPIYIAIVYYEKTEDYNGFSSAGWFKIEPNSTKTILSNINYTTYYYYAKDDNGNEWTGKGKYKFVVHTRENFKFKNAGMTYNESYFEHKVFKNFKKIDVGQQSEYTLTLAENIEE